MKRKELHKQNMNIYNRLIKMDDFYEKRFELRHKISPKGKYKSLPRADSLLKQGSSVQSLSSRKSLELDPRNMSVLNLPLYQDSILPDDILDDLNAKEVYGLSKLPDIFESPSRGTKGLTLAKHPLVEHENRTQRLAEQISRSKAMHQYQKLKAIERQNKRF